jgi:hypothetical protein
MEIDPGNGKRLWLWALSGVLGAMFALVLLMAGYIWSGMREDVRNLIVGMASLQAEMNNVKTQQMIFNERLQGFNKAMSDKAIVKRP